MINETVEARLNPSSQLKVVKPHETAEDYNTIRRGGGDGGGDDMLERVKKLEEKVNSLVTDIAVIKSNYATSADVSNVKSEIANAKADLHSALRIQALTIIGSVIATVGIAATMIIRSFPH